MKPSFLFQVDTATSLVRVTMSSQTLARMQIQRAARDRQIQYFADDIGAAERWLLSRDTMAA